MRSRLLLVILLFTNLCIAQKKDSKQKLSIGFNEGMAIPTGSFAKTDQTKLPISKLTRQDTNHLGGYAQHGFHYELYASYRVIKHLSIMISVSGNDIGYDINTLNSQYIQFFPPNTVSVTAYNHYNIVQYLLGPNLNLPLGKGVSIEAKALAGITSTPYPPLTYLGLPELEIYTLSQGKGFGYTIAAGIKYITADGYLGLHLNFSYAASNITFSNYSISSYMPVSGNYIGTSVYNTPKILAVGLLQVSLGLSIEL